ncbi:MAG: GNAT family N-acetyltransferase [Treponema sp.]|nr:GNAT family N-acetyltransferase [Treponema sp.]
MNIAFGEATKDDIDELIRMRIAYMKDDFGSVSEHEKECMENQLRDYFGRKLGTELVAFVAKDVEKNTEKIVSVAYLHIIEMPANSVLLNGFYGTVLSVFTEDEYRGKGLCTKLMQNLIAYGKEHGLGRIDLSATNDGYRIYEKLGFKEKDNRYREMRYKF